MSRKDYVKELLRSKMACNSLGPNRFLPSRTARASASFGLPPGSGRDAGRPEAARSFPDELLVVQGLALQGRLVAGVASVVEGNRRAEFGGEVLRARNEPQRLQRDQRRAARRGLRFRGREERPAQGVRQ